LLDELQKLRQGFNTEFIRVSSYEGTSSTGKVKLGGGIDLTNLTGKDVIVVEDIIDTGNTLSYLIPTLQADAQPRSVEVVSLLSKRVDDKPTKYKAKYVGFSIPDSFIIGYGLDYNELYRDLGDIYVISQKGIDFDSASLN
jgi:hypoxanthine phosphoribosyltransferase